MKIAFDTSALVEINKNKPYKQSQIAALQELLKLKHDGLPHKFVYLDAVRREIAGSTFDRIAREVEIADFMSVFDETISLSRFPIIMPVIIVGPEHGRIQDYFANQVAVSRKDSAILADVIYAKCDHFVTTDDKLLNNNQAVRGALDSYGMVILDPIQMLSQVQVEA